MYNNILAPSFPSGKSPFCFVVELRGDPKDSYRIELQGPVGTKIFIPDSIMGAPDLPIEHQQWVRTIVIQTDQIFPQPGVYSVVLMSGEKEINRRNLGVVQVVPNETEQEPERE
jgi:hypothetical protein